VNLGELAKRLRREVKASPAKAAVLAVLGGVAIYFWAPFVMRSIGTKSPVAAAPEVVVVQPASAETPPPVIEPTVGAASLSWQQLDTWMTQDERMQPVMLERLKRNPFGSPDGGRAAGTWAHSLAARFYGAGRDKLLVARELWGPGNQAISDVRPEDAGLTLSSTVVGRKPVALISGKAYVEGSTVRGEGEHADVTFKLLKIHPKSVVLSQNGVSYELKIVLTDLAKQE
jgi:hypothetical protein